MKKEYNEPVLNVAALSTEEFALTTSGGGENEIDATQVLGGN